MNRLFLGYILDWKDKKGRKPLIIRGARQVGKSTAVTLFAELAKLDLLTLNFEEKPALSDLFNSQEPKKILQLLEVEFNKTVTPGQALLFLDELQAAESVVLTSLRYFYEKLPALHIIAAGSLLEFVLEEPTFSMPVGRIEYAYLGPLTFEEFLLAMGHEKQLEFLKQYTLTETIPLSIHTQLLEMLRTYMIVGGMPEVVKTFVETHSLLSPEPVKQSILQTYEDDFAKYGKRINWQRVRKIFQRLPFCVGKKLKYVHLDPNEKSKDLEKDLHKLCQAYLGYRVRHAHANHLPLGSEVNDKIFKLLFLDVGLWTTAMGATAECIQHSQDLFGVQEGVWCEQFVGQQLLYDKPFYEPSKLFYWLREKSISHAEVDYLVAAQGKIVPVEVKAGKTGRLRSLAQFVLEKNCSLAVRFNSEPPKWENILLHLSTGELRYKLLSLPLYMVGQTRRLLG